MVRMVMKKQTVLNFLRTLIGCRNTPETAHCLGSWLSGIPNLNIPKLVLIVRIVQTRHLKKLNIYGVYVYLETAIQFLKKKMT